MALANMGNVYLHKSIKPKAPIECLSLNLGILKHPLRYQTLAGPCDRWLYVSDI